MNKKNLPDTDYWQTQLKNEQRRIKEKIISLETELESLNKKQICAHGYNWIYNSGGFLCGRCGFFLKDPPIEPRWDDYLYENK